MPLLSRHIIQSCVLVAFLLLLQSTVVSAQDALTLRGHVFFFQLDGHDTVTDAKVVLEEVSDDATSKKVFYYTDSEGYFEFDLSTDQHYVLAASKADASSARITIDPATLAVDHDFEVYLKQNSATPKPSIIPTSTVDDTSVLFEDSVLDLITFSVHLGSFSAPLESSSRFLKPIASDFKVKESNTGFDYLFGEYKSYELANSKKVQLKDEGYQKAQIVAYKGGKQISLEDALRIYKTIEIEQKESE